MKSLPFLASAILLGAGGLAAQEPEPVHEAGAHAHRLGAVDFPNSGAPAAQEPFLRGIALLHSFEYPDAAEAFRAAQAADPGFALAYWGEALTATQLLWGVDDPAEARRALAKLGPGPAERLARAGTDRERAFGAAVEAFYAEAETGVRARAFADSLRALAARAPDDPEAAAFASLALLMASATPGFEPGERDSARAEAAALAERVFRAYPEHPGAAHYLIHAYDDPVRAPHGLEAARAYAAIAPDAEHALHMPSHVFVQVGLWPDAIDSNVRAWAASRAWVTRRGASATEHDFHSLQWLQYALLQEGRLDEAAALVDTARMVLDGADLDAARFPDPRHVVATLTFALASETGDWSEWPVTEPVDPGPEASARARGFARTAAYRRAAGAAMQGDPAPAEETARAFRAESPPGPWTAFAAAQLDGLAARARGDREAALEALAAAAALEEALPPVGPPSYLPTHEVLGAALLEAGRAEEAAAAFEKALERRPNRAAAVAGLARARAAASGGD